MTFWVVRNDYGDYVDISMDGTLSLVDKDEASWFRESNVARYFAKHMTFAGTKFKVYRVVRS